jgi:alpha-L-rhamnosidase
MRTLNFIKLILVLGLIFFETEAHFIKTDTGKQTAKLNNFYALNSVSKDAPFGLTVEYIRKPEYIIILDQMPEFSWQVSQSAITQKGYQVLVASSKALLDKNIGDLWNSKKVISNKNTDISYAGKALKLHKSVFWKVKIWDHFNKASDYSTIQSFSISENPTNTLTSSNVFQIENNTPKIFKKASVNSYFIDFGKDAFANVRFKYSTEKEENITFRIGEQLENGQLNRKPQGTIRFQELVLNTKPGTHTYILPIKPDNRNTKVGAIALPDSFPVLMPFRYIEIENASAEIKPEDIIQLAYHGYFDDSQSTFSSSDSILNQVWDICKYTIKATTFSGIYVDGDRERIPYEADAYLNQLSHYSTDAEYAIARKTIEYFMHNPTWPTEWQLHVALMFYQDFMYTGNTELIAKYYEALKAKTLIDLAREDGLVSSLSEKNTPEFMHKLGFKDPQIKLKDIVDWPPAQKDTGWKLATPEGERDGYDLVPYNTMVNAFYYKNLRIMAEFAKVLRHTEDQVYFELMEAKVKKSFNEIFFDSEAGIYTDGEGSQHASLHANMTAMAFGLVPEKHKNTVVEFMKSRGMACSVYGSQYLLEALFDAGEAQFALKLLTATNDRSWYNMIKIGSTMTLEAWDMKYKPNSDWNHAWGAVPANVIARNLWGIKPKKPGASLLVIRPQLGSLKSSEIAVPFITGKVLAKYELKNNESQNYEFVLPGNVFADLDLGLSDGFEVTLNGTLINEDFINIKLSPGKNVIEVKKIKD